MFTASCHQFDGREAVHYFQASCFIIATELVMLITASSPDSIFVINYENVNCCSCNTCHSFLKPFARNFLDAEIKGECKKHFCCVIISYYIFSRLCGHEEKKEW